MLNPDDILNNPQTLESLFPATRSNEFFDALYGDPGEGAYDIKLRYGGFDAASGALTLFFDLLQRPNKCLACNLTSGLPEVFSRHPVINVQAMAAEIEKLVQARCAGWKLERTQQLERTRYAVPLVLTLTEP